METKGPLPTSPLAEAADESTTALAPTAADDRETDELSRHDYLILVVDDMVDNQIVISLNLQQQGYRVVTASDGEEAVRVARLANPDLILMDIGMPQLDGLEATRRIREREPLRNVPVIAVTAFSTGGFQRAAYDAGFEGYIVKPIDFQRLQELIRRLLPVK